MAINTEIKIDTMTNLHSRSERKTPYTGASLDDFSKFMYDFKGDANEGFTAVDIDWILRNHKKRTLALIEVKTRNGLKTYAQTIIFKEIDTMLRASAKTAANYQYIGFFTLTFENTSFENGNAFLNDKEITKEYFNKWLKHYF